VLEKIQKQALRSLAELTALDNVGPRKQNNFTIILASPRSPIYKSLDAAEVEQPSGFGAKSAQNFRRAGKAVKKQGQRLKLVSPTS